MSLISLFVAARAALARRRQWQRAFGDLSALDDRSLADIGLHRSQIPALVEGFHEAVEVDAAPAAFLPFASHRQAGLSPAQYWLHRV